MSDNRVVIKINYDKNKQAQLNAAPQMVTVWHKGRLLTALASVFLVVALLIFWLLPSNDANEAAVVAEISTPLSEASPSDQSGQPPSLPVAGNHKNPLVKEQENKSPYEKGVNHNQKPMAIIFSRKVIRASLNASLRDDEPGQAINNAVIVGQNQSIELYYFNEIRNMKGKVLFHQWLRDGHVLHKKQLEIKDNKTKTWSSKGFSAKDKGEWQVQLLDRKGVIYSEVRFWVNS